MEIPLSMLAKALEKGGVNEATVYNLARNKTKNFGSYGLRTAKVEENGKEKTVLLIESPDDLFNLVRLSCDLLGEAQRVDKMVEQEVVYQGIDYQEVKRLFETISQLKEQLGAIRKELEFKDRELKLTEKEREKLQQEIKRLSAELKEHAERLKKAIKENRKLKVKPLIEELKKKLKEDEALELIDKLLKTVEEESDV